MSRSRLTRHYYFPTCSLEVQTPGRSAWSRLLPIARQQPLQFQLVLDDPRDLQPQRDPLTLTGDRAQLQTLYASVMAAARQPPTAAAPSEAATPFVLALDFLATHPEVATITPSDRQLADLVAALSQCAAQANLTLEPELAALARSRRSPQLWAWAAAGATISLLIAGGWIARERLRWQSQVQSPPPIETETPPPATLEPLPLPPQREVDLELQEPSAPTFEAAPLAPPARVDRPRASLPERRRPSLVPVPRPRASVAAAPNDSNEPAESEAQE